MRFRIWHAFIMVSLVSACTDKDPTNPAIRRMMPHREEGGLQWVSLGSAEVGTEGTIGALPWTSTGIYVPAGVEARVWLRGKLSVTYNQAFSRFCGLGFYAPIDCYGHGFDGHQVGGAGIDIYYLAADIRIRDGGSVREIGFGIPQGSDGDPVEASVTGPGIIEVSRTGLNMPFHWEGLGEDQRYNVTGTQTLEVEALGRVDACGGVVLAGATEVGPHTDCVPVPKPEPKPRMKCTDQAGRENAVVRGESIVCRVVVDPDTGWVTASAWQARFTAIQDNTVFPDPLTDQMPPRALSVKPVTLPGPASSASWGGVMVAPTTISATVSGTTVTAAVAIEPRATWQSVVYPPIPEGVFTKTDLTYPPVSNGSPLLGDGVLGKSEMPTLRTSGTADGSGPNENWWFLSAPPHLAPDVTILLNAGLIPSDPFYRAQTGSATLSFGRPMCSQDFMRFVARQVPRHERTHIERDQAFLTSPAANKLLEQAIYYDDPSIPHESNSYFEPQLLAELTYARYSVQSAWDAQDKLQVACDFNTSYR